MPSYPSDSFSAREKKDWFAKIRQMEKKIFPEVVISAENELITGGQRLTELPTGPSYKLITKQKNSIIFDRLSADFYHCLRLAGRPIIYLGVVEIMILGLSQLSYLDKIMFNVFSPLSLVLDFIVFVWLGWLVVFKRNEGFFRAIKVNFLTGFGVGLAAGLARVLMIQEFWTILALVFEAVLLGFYGLIVALATSSVIRLTKT